MRTELRKMKKLKCTEKMLLMLLLTPGKIFVREDFEKFELQRDSEILELLNKLKIIEYWRTMNTKNQDTY